MVIEQKFWESMQTNIFHPLKNPAHTNLPVAFQRVPIDKRKVLVCKGSKIKWNLQTIPLGYGCFRGASAKSLADALSYNQADSPRFYGDLSTALAYLRDGDKEIYYCIFNKLKVVNFKAFIRILLVTFNDYFTSKIDNIYGSEAYEKMVTLVHNPLSLLRTKDGEKPNPTYLDYGPLWPNGICAPKPGDSGVRPPINGKRTYIDTEFLIQYISLFIAYGGCNPDNILEYAKYYNELVTEYISKYGKPKADEKKFINIPIEYLDQHAQTEYTFQVKKHCPPKFVGTITYRYSHNTWDDIAMGFISSTLKELDIDGYFNMEQKTPWGLSRTHGRNRSRRFHSEIALINPKKSILGVLRLFGGMKPNKYSFEDFCRTLPVHNIMEVKNSISQWSLMHTPGSTWAPETGVTDFDGLYSSKGKFKEVDVRGVTLTFKGGSQTMTMSQLLNPTKSKGTKKNSRFPGKGHTLNENTSSKSKGTKKNSRFPGIGQKLSENIPLPSEKKVEEDEQIPLEEREDREEGFVKSREETEQTIKKIMELNKNAMSPEKDSSFKDFIEFFKENNDFDNCVCPDSSTSGVSKTMSGGKNSKNKRNKSKKNQKERCR